MVKIIKYIYINYKKYFNKIYLFIKNFITLYKIINYLQ